VAAPRVVYDCMVFLQGIVGSEDGPAAACLRLVEERQVQLLLSPSTLAELTDVLSRPKLRLKFPAITDEIESAFLHHLVSIAETLPDPARVFALPRDPGDEPYLNLAIEGEARFLVSWNQRHLNYLMTDDAPEAKDFRARYPELQIVTPPEFLEAMRNAASEGEGA